MPWHTCGERKTTYRCHSSIPPPESWDLNSGTGLVASLSPPRDLQASVSILKSVHRQNVPATRPPFNISNGRMWLSNRDFYFFS